MTLLFLTLAWAGGIVLCHMLWSRGVIGCTTPGWPFGAAAGAAALIVLLLRGRLRARLAAALVLFALLGSWRYLTHPFAPCPTPTDLAFYNSQGGQPTEDTIEGLVDGYPDVRDVRANYRLRAETFNSSGRAHPVRGYALVQTSRFPAYRYGDRLRVTGYLQAPPTFDDFDYRAYLARQGIHSLVRQARVELVTRDQGPWFWTILYKLRARGSALLDRALPEPAAALANGMLLGIEGSIPREVDEAFKVTGASHVIVISGSNIALLAGVMMALIVGIVGKRRAALPVAAGIILYVLLVGAEPAALRAGMMGVLYVIAIAIGRQSTAWVSLVASALFMTILNPLTLWDIGFQLSFMATLGLILFAPPMTAGFERLRGRQPANSGFWQPFDRLRAGSLRWLSDALIVTLAAQVTALPLIVHYFGRLSLISLVTNLLILPAQPAIMAGGIATLLGGFVWEPLGRILAAIPWLFLTYTNGVVKLMAAIPYGSLETGGLSGALLLLYYGVLFGMYVARHHLIPSAHSSLVTNWIPFPTRQAVALAMAAILPLWLGLSAVRNLPDGKLHVTYMPGEGGETALLVTPGGQRVWVFDGLEDSMALAGATQAQPGRRPRPSDIAVAPQAVALSWPGAQAIDPAQLAPGAIVRLDSGATLTRLDAGDDWALALRYGQFRTLLPANLGPDGQAALLRAATDDPHVTVLKAPGPGTGSWPTSAFLTTVAPQLILWPEDTTYPPDIAELLAARDIVRLPPDAEVEVITDGQRLWLRQWSAAGE